MYFLKRILYMVFVLIGVSMLMFVLVRAIPGDPVAKALGPMADEETIEIVRKQMGLDRPIPVQYVLYIKGILKGRLGISLLENRDVWEIIREKLPATVELISVSIAFAVMAGIPLGVISALHRNSVVDHLSRIIALFGVSFPQFWIRSWHSSYHREDFRIAS
jgi:peptide/nickel transport system permease protein